MSVYSSYSFLTSCVTTNGSEPKSKQGTVDKKAPSSGQFGGQGPTNLSTITSE